MISHRVRKKILDTVGKVYVRISIDVYNVRAVFTDAYILLKVKANIQTNVCVPR